MADPIAVDWQALLDKLRQYGSKLPVAAEPEPIGKPNPCMACEPKQLEACGVYRRYQDASFAAIQARGVPEELREPVRVVRDFAQQLPAHLAAGEGLVLRGPVGTLKTTLAVAVLQYCVQLGGRAMFLTMPSLIDSIFSAKAVSPEDWLRFESRLRQVPLLVLDDLGAEWGSGYVMSKVDAIFSERYNRKRSTIVTTNLAGKSLQSRYPDRIIDRLRATAQIITLNTPASLRETCR